MKNIEIVFFLILPLVISFEEPNYCYDDLCHTEEFDHVTCDVGTPDDCDSPKLMDLKESFKGRILHWFNYLRHEIAVGDQCKPNLKCPEAARMAEMHWDDELQSLAELYVKRCNLTDACLNTERFSNVALFKRRIYYPTFRQIRNQIEYELDGHVLAKFTPELIKSYNASGSNHRSWTDTANIAVDKNYLLGCAIFEYKNSMKQGRALFACLMPTKAVEGKPIFQIGPAGSACETENPDYGYELCSTEEHYNVN